MSDFRSLLLGALMPGADRAALIRQIIAGAEVDHATREAMEAYLDQVLQTTPAEAETPVEAENSERVHQLSAALEDAGETLSRVYAEVEGLRQERDRLRSRLRKLTEKHRRLAAALGICGNCLGEDADCQDCGGRGGPGTGFFQPNQQLFRRFVGPLLSASGHGRTGFSD